MYFLIVVYYLAHGLVTQSAIKAPSLADCEAAGLTIEQTTPHITVMGRQWDVEKIKHKCVAFDAD